MPKIDAQVGIRVTKDLKSRLERQARSEMKSVSALIVGVMEEYLASREKGAPMRNEGQTVDKV